MEKVIHRVSTLLILFTIGVSNSIWLLGISHPLIDPFFSDFAYWLGGLMIVVILLNIKKLTRGDWVFLGLALADSIINIFTADYRNAATLDMSIIPAVIFLFVLACRLVPFDKVDKSLMLAINVIILLLMLFRLFKHLINAGLIGNFFTLDNSLIQIWINVNVIGAVIMFSSILSVLMIRSLELKGGKIWQSLLYLLGLIGTWGCQSRTSFLVLAAFIFLDLVLPKQFLEKHRFWLWGFPLLFLLAPFVTWFIAKSPSMNLFTDRENIWHAFFQQWLPSKRAIFTGQKPFLYGPHLFSTHNSYLYLLCNFGVIGYVFLSSGLSYTILKLRNKMATLSHEQISCLIAFFLALAYGFMEDSLMVIQWVPIMFCFLGLAVAPATKKVQ